VGPALYLEGLMDDSEFTYCRMSACAHFASRLPGRSESRHAFPPVPAVMLLDSIKLRYVATPRPHANSTPTS
jgi:hypothetical protein